jgi:hypothetical protein
VELEAFNKAEHKRDDGRGYLRSTSQTNETQECDTQTMTLIKSMQTMLSELQQEVKSSLIETRVTVAPVSTNMLAFNPFTLAFINIPAALVNLLTLIEPLL